MLFLLFSGRSLPQLLPEFSECAFSALHAQEASINSSKDPCIAFDDIPPPPTLLADKGLGSMEAVSTLRSHCVSTHFPASLSISYLLRSYACGRFILLSSEQPTPFFLLRLTQ